MWCLKYYKFKGVEDVFSIDEQSLNNSLSFIEKMTKASENKEINADQDFVFTPFQINNHSNKIAAVDGSNNGILGVNFLIGMLRAGHLIYHEGKLVEESISPIKMETLINSNGDEGYYDIYQKYFYELTKEYPDNQIEFDKVAERLRTLMEWKYISNLIDDLGYGDVIIFDGSLISGAISTNHLFYSDLVSKARSNGVTLMGLSKDTSLSIDNVPIPVVLKEIAKNENIDTNWFVRVELEDESEVAKEKNPEETYFVKFSKNKDLIFRCDVVYPVEFEFEDVISKVAAYSYDVRTFGYPFPMQRIHDRVRISELEKEQSFIILKNRWLKNQKTSNSLEIQEAIVKFEKMFSIYHNQLDIISSGR